MRKKKCKDCYYEFVCVEGLEACIKDEEFNTPTLKEQLEYVEEV